jgi:hypothetical protein
MPDLGHRAKHATGLRLRAERMAGELLAEMKAKGERQKAGDNPQGRNRNRPQCIIGTQISGILDVTRTRLHDHAARCSAPLLIGRMPSAS